MQIGKILYPITTLGPGMRLGIWTQGCDRRCRGCSNPELQEWDQSKDAPAEGIVDGIKALEFDGVTISGGEPFLQAAELRRMIDLFISMGVDDILVFTGFYENELREMKDPDVDSVLSNIAVLVDGPFIESRYVEDPLRGSDNQNVIVLNEKYADSYDVYRKEEKKIDVFRFENEVHFIGIPSPGYDDVYRKFAAGGMR